MFKHEILYILEYFILCWAGRGGTFSLHILSELVVGVELSGTTIRPLSNSQNESGRGLKICMWVL